ncbi:MAG: hypothetical protein A2W85_16625 [Bacteroidetes bacterium GWF2_41_31]|nr:MAG: hypothetical protein A2W85_16625 [Bacteroidetes bacterium GWF2_41_31]
MVEMSGMKTTLIKGLNKLMLTCDGASLLMDQSGFVKLSCIKWTQLKMHLMVCEFCRDYLKQSHIINSHLAHMGSVEAKNLTWKLTEDQKMRLAEVVEKQLNKP